MKPAPGTETPFVQRSGGGDRRWVRNLSDDELLERYKVARGLPILRTLLAQEIFRRNLDWGS